MMLRTIAFEIDHRALHSVATELSGHDSIERAERERKRDGEPLSGKWNFCTSPLLVRDRLSTDYSVFRRL